MRWEYHAENYLGFVLLACIKMLTNIYGIRCFNSTFLKFISVLWYTDLYNSVT